MKQTSTNNLILKCLLMLSTCIGIRILRRHHITNYVSFLRREVYRWLISLRNGWRGIRRGRKLGRLLRIRSIYCLGNCIRSLLSKWAVSYRRSRSNSYCRHSQTHSSSPPCTKNCSKPTKKATTISNYKK